MEQLTGKLETLLSRMVAVGKWQQQATKGNSPNSESQWACLSKEGNNHFMLIGRTIDPLWTPDPPLEHCKKYRWWHHIVKEGPVV
jgi:hypothetical protein